MQPAMLSPVSPPTPSPFESSPGFPKASLPFLFAPPPSALQVATWGGGVSWSPTQAGPVREIPVQISLLPDPGRTPEAGEADRV